MVKERCNMFSCAMPFRYWEIPEEWERSHVHNWLALGWPKLTGLYIVLIPARQKSIWCRQLLGVWPLLARGACVGMCLPTCLVGATTSNAFCSPSVLLERTAPPGDLVWGGGSCWTPDSRRELGYLWLSSVDEQMIVSPLCTQCFLVEYLGWGGEGVSICIGHHKLVTAWWKVQRGDCVKHLLLLDPNNCVIGSKM